MMMSELTEAIPYAENRTSSSWMPTCQELRGRNPTATVTVLVKDKHRPHLGRLHDHNRRAAHGQQERDGGAERRTGEVPEARDPRPAGPQDRARRHDLRQRRGQHAAADDLAVAVRPAPGDALLVDKSGTSKGEWTDPKGPKRETQTDIVVRATGFG